MDSILLFQSMTVKMSTTLDKVFKAQEMDFGRHAYSFIYSFELLMDFVEEVQSRAFGEAPSSLTEYDYQRMLMVKELLLANLAEPPQTQELCDRFGLSAQKLRNDFKTMYGVPPYQFVLHQCFEIAYQQLAEGKSSIKELAFDLGFANPNHFNKAFKKHFGVNAGSVKK